MSKPLVLIPLLGVILAVGLAAIPGSRSAHGAVVLRGYPYATRCPAAGYKDKVDRWGMYMCNCTSYVTWALRANGQRTDWFIRGSMDAWNWPHVARLARLSVGTLPHAGAVAVWPKIGKPFDRFVTWVGLTAVFPNPVAYASTSGLPGKLHFARPAGE